MSSSLTVHSLLLHCGHGKKCVRELELWLLAAEQYTSTHSVSTTDSHMSIGLWPPDLMFICGITGNRKVSGNNPYGMRIQVCWKKQRVAG